MKSENNSSKQGKRVYCLEFTEYLYKRVVEYEEASICLKKQIICLIELLNSIQFIGLLLSNFPLSNSYQTRTNSEGSLQILRILCEIVRPYLYLNSTLKKYLFLIPLLAYLLLLILTLLKTFVAQRYFKNNKQKTKYQKFKTSLQPQLVTYFIIFYISILQIPFFEMVLQALQVALQDTEIVLLIFILLTLLILIIFTLFALMFQETVSINIKNNHILNYTQTEFWTNIIIIIVVLITTLDLEQYSKFYLLFSLTILIYILKIINLYTNYPTLKINSLIKLFCYSFNLFIALLMFIAIQQDTHSKSTQLQFLLIFPLIFYIIQKAFNYVHIKALVNNKGEEDCQQIQYRLSYLIGIYFQINGVYEGDTEIKLHIHRYFSLHKEICEKIACQCASKDKLSLDNMLATYLQGQTKYFGQQLNQIKDYSNKFSFFLHYLSLVSLLGISKNVMLQSNLIYEDSQISSKNETDKEKYDRIATYQSNDFTGKSHLKSKSFVQQESSPHMRLKQLNFFQITKLNIIKDLIKSQINLNLSLSNNIDQQMQDKLSYAVKLFLEAEANNATFKKKVMKMIERKKLFFHHITDSNKFDIFKESKTIMTKLVQLEKQLEQMQVQFPSQKMKALNSFFQAELRNNYYKAFNLANFTSISDEKLLKMQTTSNFDLFSNDVVYLIIQYNESTHKLSINSSSNLIHQFFNIPLECYQAQSTIDSLLPQNFSTIHEKLIQMFLQKGSSKYFREIGLNFCRWSNQFIKPINFFFEINQVGNEDLSFVCFLQNFDIQSAYIILNSKYNIISFTNNLAQKLGYSQQYHQHLNNLISRISILTIIPKFKDFMADFEENSMNQQSSKSLDGLKMIIPNQQSTVQQLKSTESESLRQYNIDGQVHVRFIEYEIHYLIIEIRNLILNFDTKSTLDAQQEELIYKEFNELDDQLEKEDMIKYPYQFQIIEEFSENHSFRQIDLQQRFQNYEIASSPQFILNTFNQNSCFNTNRFLLSPKINNQEQLIQEICNRNSNQHFYNISFHQQSDSAKVTNKDINLYPPENQIDQLQMEGIEEELQENIKNQMKEQQKKIKFAQTDDIGSQASSMAGIQKSKYFKKYELYFNIITSNKFSYYFITSTIFIYLMILLTFASQLGTIILSNNDFNQYLQEIDMIQIRSNIIGPLNKFILCSNAISQYGILFFEAAYPLDVAIQKMQYPQADFEYSYQELKNNSENQLSNQYLLPFFKNRYMIINQGDFPKLLQYNMTLREGLNLLKQASYLFINNNYLEILSLDFTAPYLVYVYSNYQSFNEIFRSINQEMLSYSINRSHESSIQWYTIMIPNLVFSACLLLISYGFHIAYKKQYEKITQLFSNLDQVWVQRDVERYQGILALLKRDSNVLFKYQFDLEVKENFLNAEEIRKEKIALNYKQNKGKKKNINTIYISNTNLMLSILPFFLLFGLFFTFSFISHIMAQDFFSKYPETTTFFNTLSDLSISSSGVLAMRELMYQINNGEIEVFYYFNETDRSYFKELFFESIDDINNFLILLNSFDNNNYITTNDFVNELQLLLTSDVCNFLPDNRRELAQSHCDAIYNGVLRSGLQQTLIQVRDSLLNEYYIIGDFRAKVYTTNEEMEGGLISYDAINQLRQQFQKELINHTKDLIYNITILNIIYIIIIYLIMFFIQKFIKQFYKHEFNLVKQFILLLPQSSLFLDSQLERQIRQIITKNDIL